MNLHYETLKHIEKIQLSPRQIDITSLVLQRLSTKEIAAILNVTNHSNGKSLSTSAVNAHISEISTKITGNRGGKVAIISYLQESSKLKLFQEHASALIYENRFQKNLKIISSQVKIRPKIVIFSDNPTTETRLFLKRLETHLRLLSVSLAMHSMKNESIHSISLEEKFDTGLYLVSSTNRELISSIIEMPKISKKVILYTLQDETVLNEQNRNEVQIFTCTQDNYYVVFSRFISGLLNIDSKELSISPVAKHEHNLENRSLFIPHNQLKKTFTENKWTKIILSILFFIVLFFWFTYYTNSSSFVNTNIYFPNKHNFYAPKGLIASLDKKRCRQKELQHVLLIGPGGVGKTTLARHYALTKKSGDIIWQLNCETHENLLSDFIGLAYGLCKNNEQRESVRFILSVKDQQQKKEQLVAWVSQNIQKHKNWTLIFDNIENISNVIEFLPHNKEVWGKGLVITTSRNINIANYHHFNDNNTLYMKEMKLEDATDLFLYILKNNGEKTFLIPNAKDTKKFIEKIPPFPLDISTAAYFIKNYNISYDDYLKYLDGNDKTYQNIVNKLSSQFLSYPRSRVGIISLAVKNILVEDPDYKKLFALISILDSQYIPKKLLSILSTPLKSEAFIQSLKKHSLIHLHEKNSEFISVHRSTQQILRFILKEQNPALYKSTEKNNMVGALDVYIKALIKQRSFEKLWKFSPSLDKILERLSLPTDKNFPFIITLALAHEFIGNYDTAREIARELLKKFRGKNGIMNVRYKYLYSLINLIKRLGYFKEIIEITQKNLPEYISHYGKYDKNLVHILRFLTYAYRQSGKYEEALKTIERGLTYTKKQLFDTPYCQSYFLREKGNIHWEKKQYKKALKYLLEAHNLLQNAQHDTLHKTLYASIQAYLGKTLERLQRYPEAAEMLEKAHKLFNSVYIKPSIYPAWTKGYLGYVMFKQNHINKACNFLESSLVTHEIVYGRYSLNILWILDLLAEVYLDQKMFNKALDSLNRVVKIVSKEYGNMHPKLIQSNYQIVGVYKKLKNISMVKKHQNIMQILCKRIHNNNSFCKLGNM